MELVEERRVAWWGRHRRRRASGGQDGGRCGGQVIGWDRRSSRGEFDGRDAVEDEVGELAQDGGEAAEGGRPRGENRGNLLASSSVALGLGLAPRMVDP